MRITILFFILIVGIAAVAWGQKPRSHCNVSINLIHEEIGPQCFYGNEVMVGIGSEPPHVMCGTLIVDCQ